MCVCVFFFLGGGWGAEIKKRGEGIINEMEKKKNILRMKQ